MKAKTICLILATMLMSGCAAQRQIAQDYQKDSIRVEVRDSIIYRDSVVYVQVEAEKDSVVLPDTDTSRLATRYAESEAYVSKGQLHHSLRNKSEALIPIETKIPITIHFESKATIRDKRIVEVVEVEKQLSRWQRFIMALGYGALGLLAGWIAIRLSKIIR